VAFVSRFMRCLKGGNVRSLAFNYVVMLLVLYVVVVASLVTL
jgi:hypothetical protein